MKYQISATEYEQELVVQNRQWNCMLNSAPTLSFEPRFPRHINSYDRKNKRLQSLDSFSLLQLF